jgi:hypothetical protein
MDRVVRKVCLLNSGPKTNITYKQLLDDYQQTIADQELLQTVFFVTGAQQKY